MADNEKPPETKEKRTVPALIRTARGVADHAAAVQAMQYDDHKKAFKDPIVVMLALFGYAKVTAALLDEAEARINARETSLEVRCQKLEQQIASFEAWRTEVTEQSTEMQKEMEAMMGGDPVAKLQEILASRAPAAPAIIDATVEEPATPVVPIKSDDKKKSAAEKNGGAA